MMDAPSGVLDSLLAGIDAEGLTPAALQEYLRKIEVRKEEVLLTLYANVAESFSAGDDEPEAGTQEQRQQAEEDTLEELACTSSLAALDPQQPQQQGGAAAAGPPPKLVALAARHVALCAEQRGVDARLGGARVAAEMQQRLADLDAQAQQGLYSEAAWTLVELRKAVALVSGQEAAAAAVEGRAGLLTSHLLGLSLRCVAADPATHVLRAAAAPADAAAAAAARDVWEALGVLGLLPEALRQLAAAAMRASFLPILSAGVSGSSGAPGSGGAPSPGASVASSALSQVTGLTDARGGGCGAVERAVYKSMRALAAAALGGSPEHAPELGAALWPDLAAAYIDAKLKPSLPQVDGEVELFMRHGALGCKLEAKAAKLGLLPPDREGPVVRFVRHAANRFLNAKRGAFVAAARDLLTSASARETATVGVPARLGGGTGCGATPDELSGEPSVLATGEYVVTRGAEGVVHLMHDALTEACRSGNGALAQCMCGAVVDVAAMLCALPPVEQGAGEGAELLPYPAAVRHNDCFHVYQALCNLPYLYAPRLQQLVHRNVNFVNPAQRVRRAGDDALHAMVERQREELLRVAGGFGRFSGLDGPALIRGRKAAAQLLAALRRLGAVLRGVLAPAAHADVAAALLQPLAAGICADILALSDISVDESEQIPEVLGELVREAADAALPPPPSAPGGGAEDGGGRGGDDVALTAARLALGQQTPALAKLRELLQLLDIQLREIWRRWHEGRLRALGFSAREVAHLVAALFEDTDPRRDFLAVLRAAEREAGGR